MGNLIRLSPMTMIIREKSTKPRDLRTKVSYSETILPTIITISEEPIEM